MNRKRLIRAYEIIDGIPAERFNLDAIVNGLPDPNRCGTIACALGWLCMHPEFQALGAGVTSYGGVIWKGRSLQYDLVGARLFGLHRSEAYQLFRPRSGLRGETYKAYPSDKALWQARCRRLLGLQP